MNIDADDRLPGKDDVIAAAERLQGVANQTPVFTSRTLDLRTGASVFVKAENLQRSGAFKFRGAYNAISKLSSADRARGVLSYSSGNHAQAVALVGHLLDVRTTIIMPDDAPRAKLDATRAYGAEVIRYSPSQTKREQLAETVQAELGSILIPPYDHPDIVAGQGTAALELLEEVPDLDWIFTPCGGGGLLSGTSLAASHTGCRVIGVEPALADDAARSFHSGTLQSISNPPTIADGLRTPSLGDTTWPIIRERVHDIITVDEASIVKAMRFYWTRMKLVVEPSGAVALAGLMSRRAMVEGTRAGVIVSGGNVDLVTACELFTDANQLIH